MRERSALPVAVDPEKRPKSRISAVPTLGASAVPSTDSSEVLPAPEGPIRAMRSPLRRLQRDAGQGGETVGVGQPHANQRKTHFSKPADWAAFSMPS